MCFASEKLKLCVTFSTRGHTLDQITKFFKERLQLKIKLLHEAEYKVDEELKQSLSTKDVVSYSSNDEVKMNISFAFKGDINYRRSGSIYSFWLADQCLVDQMIVLAENSFTQLCQSYKLNVHQWKNVYNWARSIPWLEKFAIEKRMRLVSKLSGPNPILKTKVESVSQEGLSLSHTRMTASAKAEIFMRFACLFNHLPVSEDLIISPERVKFLSIEPIFSSKIELRVSIVPIIRNDNEVTFDLTFTLVGTARGVYSVWLDEYLMVEEMTVQPKRSIKKVATQPKTLNLHSKLNKKKDALKSLKEAEKGFLFQDSGDSQQDLETSGMSLQSTHDKSQEELEENKTDHPGNALSPINQDVKTASQVLVEKEFLLPRVKEPSDCWRNPSEGPVRALLNKDNWSSLLVLNRYILEEKVQVTPKLLRPSDQASADRDQRPSHAL